MKGCHPCGRGPDTPTRNLLDTIFCMNRLHRTVLERGLNKTGVYRSQHQLLMFVSENPRVTQKELAGLYHVSTATVAVSLKKLEQGGYIERTVDRRDNRCNQICITEKGKKIVEHSIHYFQKVEARMFDGFSEKELRTLQTFMNRICKNLEQMIPDAEREEET